MGRWELEEKVVAVDSASPGKKPAVGDPDVPVVQLWGSAHIIPPRLCGVLQRTLSVRQAGRSPSLGAGTSQEYEGAREEDEVRPLPEVALPLPCLHTRDLPRGEPPALDTLDRCHSLTCAVACVDSCLPHWTVSSSQSWCSPSRAPRSVLGTLRRAIGTRPHWWLHIVHPLKIFSF